VACPSAARFGPERRRTPIDGVWVMDSSRADVSAAQRNADVENTHPENLGHYVYVFDRGRFADTQRYEDACTWGYGKYTVNGHTMRWLFTDGGGISPNGAYSKPGEDFKFTWSRYRDTLTVGPVKRAISPLNFRLRSWHRVGAKASDNVFDKRCPPPPQWDSP
jgi:hypothetical protein